MMSRGRASHVVSPLLVAVLVAVSACVSTDAIDDDTFMPASSPLVSWSGRMAVAVDGSVAFDWENTAASFVVNGQGASVTLLANITVATARVSVYVNGYDAANIMMRKGKLNAHFALDGAHPVTALDGTHHHCTGWHTPSRCRAPVAHSHHYSSNEACIIQKRHALSGASRLSEALRMSRSCVCDHSFIFALLLISVSHARTCVVITMQLTHNHRANLRTPARTHACDTTSGTPSYLLASMLPDAVNNVTVLYAFEPGAAGADRDSGQTCSFFGFVAGDGGSFAAAVPLARRIDILGDSITAGSMYDKLQAVNGPLSLNDGCHPWSPMTGYRCVWQP
jgi:hypothetical protein